MQQRIMGIVACYIIMAIIFVSLSATKVHYFFLIPVSQNNALDISKLEIIKIARGILKWSFLSPLVLVVSTVKFPHWDKKWIKFSFSNLNARHLLMYGSLTVLSPNTPRFQLGTQVLIWIFYLQHTYTI